MTPLVLVPMRGLPETAIVGSRGEEVSCHEENRRHPPDRSDCGVVVLSHHVREVEDGTRPNRLGEVGWQATVPDEWRHEEVPFGLIAAPLIGSDPFSLDPLRTSSGSTEGGLEIHDCRDGVGGTDDEELGVQPSRVASAPRRIPSWRQSVLRLRLARGQRNKNREHDCNRLHLKLLSA